MIFLKMKNFRLGSFSYSKGCPDKVTAKPAMLPLIKSTRNDFDS